MHSDCPASERYIFGTSVPNHAVRLVGKPNRFQAAPLNQSPSLPFSRPSFSSGFEEDFDENTQGISPTDKEGDQCAWGQDVVTFPAHWYVWTMTQNEDGEMNTYV